MTKVVIINKEGIVTTETIKKVQMANLHKKCKFRKPDDFEKRHTWKYKDKWVSIYGKNTGRSNSENKYDLPPPIDNELYFGSLLAIMHENETPVDDEVCDFEKEEWLKVYEKLFGGFEDLTSTAQADDEEEDELEGISPSNKTKEGYLKDGFVVSDDVLDEEDDSDYVCPSEEESAEDNNSEDEDEEANYGGGTDDEDENTNDDEDYVTEDEESEDGGASELSEDEYSY